MFRISGKPLYFNKSLRDFCLQSINDSVEKIIEKSADPNNDIQKIIHNEVDSLNETQVLHKTNKLLPFGIFMCVFIILYSNKK